MAKLDETIAARFFDAKGARQELGINRNRWDYWVKRGIIRGTEVEGVGTLYEKGHIQALAGQFEALLLAAQLPETVCRRATVADIEAEIQLAILCFGERAVETKEARIAFLEKNPAITTHLYDKGVLVAAINLLSLEHSAIEEFREGKRGWLFPTSVLRQFEPGVPLETIIIDFMATPTVSLSKRAAYAMRLLSCLSEEMASFGRQGVDIVSIDACGSTEYGRRVLSSAGFTFLGRKGGNRYMYYLDVASSDLLLLQPYKKALEEYKQSRGS